MFVVGVMVTTLWFTVVLIHAANRLPHLFLLLFFCCMIIVFVHLETRFLSFALFTIGYQTDLPLYPFLLLVARFVAVTSVFFSSSLPHSFLLL